MDKVKLKDPNGIFKDPQTGLSIVKAAVVPLKQPIGKLTQLWLNGGGLIRIKGDTPPKKIAPSPGEETAVDGGLSLLSPPEPPPSPPAESENLEEAAPVETEKAPEPAETKKPVAKKAPVKKAAAKKKG